MQLTASQWSMLRNLEKMGGRGPDGPYVNKEDGRVLMRLGLIKAVKPPAPFIPYVILTEAGYEALAKSGVD